MDIEFILNRIKKMIDTAKPYHIPIINKYIELFVKMINRKIKSSYDSQLYLFYLGRIYELKKKLIENN